MFTFLSKSRNIDNLDKNHTKAYYFEKQYLFTVLRRGRSPFKSLNLDTLGNLIHRSELAMSKAAIFGAMYNDHQNNKHSSLTAEDQDGQHGRNLFVIEPLARHRIY